MRTIRLASLMALGAFVGNVLTIGPGNLHDLVEKQLEATLFGALAGLVLEGLIRAGTSAEEVTQNKRWSFSIRDLLIAVAIAAIALWTIVALWSAP